MTQPLATDEEKVVVRVCHGTTRPPGRAYFAVFTSGAVEELPFEVVEERYGERPWR